MVVGVQQDSQQQQQDPETAAAQRVVMSRKGKHVPHQLKWDLKYLELIRFKQTHGHLHLPLSQIHHHHHRYPWRRYLRPVLLRLLLLLLLLTRTLGLLVLAFGILLGIFSGELCLAIVIILSTMTK
jgi:hypothetical protein